jgi:hypothetical protein
MREFVRADLPELIVAGERLRSLIARTSVPFALLAGIGADRLGGEVLRALANAILDAARLQYAPRPYDFQQIGGPAVGLLVARIAGGRAGALGYLAYSGVVIALGWIGRALTCAQIGSSGDIRSLGLASFCVYGPLDLLAGALPMLVGLAIGGVAARAVGTAARQGANPLLEAAGAYAAPAVVFGFGARFFTYPVGQIEPQRIAYVVGVAILAGLLAGVIAGIRSRTPLRTAIVLAAVLVAVWLYPLGVSQFEMAARAGWDELSERPEILLFALPLLDAITVPLTALIVADASARSTRADLP